MFLGKGGGLKLVSKEARERGKKERCIQPISEEMKVGGKGSSCLQVTGVAKQGDRGNTFKLIIQSCIMIQ